MSKGNKRWKRLKQAEFDREKKRLGYGNGFLTQAVRAKIWAIVKAKLPISVSPDPDPPPWVAAQRANEQMERAARLESDYGFGDYYGY